MKPVRFFILFVTLLFVAACSDSSMPTADNSQDTTYLGSIELTLGDTGLQVQSNTLLTCARFSLGNSTINTNTGFSFSVPYTIDTSGCSEQLTNLSLIPLNLPNTVGNSPFVSGATAIPQAVAESVAYLGTTDVSASESALNAELPGANTNEFDLTNAAIIPVAFTNNSVAFTASESFSGSMIVGVFSLLDSAIEQVNLTVIPTGSGTITSTNEEINCSVDTADQCEASFNAGSTVELTATPIPLEGFTVEWGGACAGTEGNVCSVELTADTTVEANFVEGQAETFTLSVVPTGQGTVTSTNGEINCSIDTADQCEASFDAGSTVDLTATPLEGFTVEWGGACAGTEGNVCSVTLTENTQVQANFVQDQAQGTFTITASPSNNEDRGCAGDDAFTTNDNTDIAIPLDQAPNDFFTQWINGVSPFTGCAIDISLDRDNYTLPITLSIEVNNGQSNFTDVIEFSFPQTLNGGTSAATASFSISNPNVAPVRGLGTITITATGEDGTQTSASLDFEIYSTQDTTGQD